LPLRESVVDCAFKMADPSVVVVGAGAIGGFVGALLYEAGVRVKFLVRENSRNRIYESLIKEGFTASCTDDAHFRAHIPAANASAIFTSDSAACLASCTCIFVATKRTANKVVHEQLRSSGVRCPVVFLQNGLRIRDDLDSPSYELIESVVNFNVVLDSVGCKVTLTQAMEDACLVLDGKQPSAGSVADLFANAPIKVKVHQSLYQVQCGKLLMNLTNAVNALSGIPIAPMLMQKPYRLVLAASIREANAVFAAEGTEPLATEKKDKLLIKWFATLLRSPEWVFQATIGRKLKGRAEGRASMAQDLMAFRVPTEINYLNGEIVRLGKAHGVPTPVNEKMIQFIREAEAANKGCPGIPGEKLSASVGMGPHTGCASTCWPQRGSSL